MKFFKPEEEASIVSAIREAEAKSSGEIRVHLAKRCVGSPHDAAGKVFEKLGMTRTALRNGVLFFLVISDRKFAVIGDSGIHEKVGPEFWETIRDALQADFRRGEFAKGLIDGIRACGDQLARHFPRQIDDRNELSDQISTDEPSVS